MSDAPVRLMNPQFFAEIKDAGFAKHGCTASPREVGRGFGPFVLLLALRGFSYDEGAGVV
jgi:hypothetical protein